MKCEVAFSRNVIKLAANKIPMGNLWNQNTYFAKHVVLNINGHLHLENCQPREKIVGSECSSSDTEITNRNYGLCMQGPWVFGMCCRRDNIVERWLFIVLKRDWATLFPIIQMEIEPGTTIFLDELKAYISLKDHGYIHDIVNHKNNFIDAQTGAETQTMECYWHHIKVKYGIKENGDAP